HAILGLDEQCIADDARVVHEDVQAAEVPDHGVHGVDHGGLGRHVHGVVASDYACPLKGLPRGSQVAGVHVQHRNVTAVTPQPFRQCPPDTAACARDHDGLSW